MELEELIAENERRKLLLADDYDPVKGVGSTGDRTSYNATRWQEGEVLLPRSMVSDPSFCPAMTRNDYQRLRMRHDFEYWCVTCVRIRHKVTGRIVPFVLNRPQRKLLAVMERQRCARKPVRVMLLKARQWGGSSLIQIYMAWWQLQLHENCHSVICTHVKDASITIKGMYAQLLANYPEEFL